MVPASLKIFSQFVVNLAERLVFLPQSLNLSSSLLNLPNSDFMSILSIFQIFDVVIVFDDLSLNGFLDMPIFSPVFLI